MKKPARTSGRKKYRSVALTIAGSDPGGGAGIQADLKTFAALGVYGYSAITSVIAQNSSTVNRVAPVDAAMVAAQIETLVAERRPDAIKTGALGNMKIVEAVADAISRLDLPAPVVDPVLISSAGARLLDPAGERALLKRLLPLARIVTPNLAEAQALSGVDGESPAAIRAMARALGKAGARAVLIKGGHIGALSRSRCAIDRLVLRRPRFRRIAGGANSRRRRAWSRMRAVGGDRRLPRARDGSHRRRAPRQALRDGGAERELQAWRRARRARSFRAQVKGGRQLSEEVTSTCLSSHSLRQWSTR